MKPTAVLASLLFCFASAGCSGSDPTGSAAETTEAGLLKQEGAIVREDDAALRGRDAAPSTSDDAGPTGESDAATQTANSDDAQAADSDADTLAVNPACASVASIATIIAKHASSNNHSTVTPMGLHFEAAAKALPISSKEAAFLANASANPTPAQATVAKNVSWQSVNVTLYPEGRPSPEDIVQHDIGDCDGVASLGSLAYVNPSLIMSIITDNGGGTFDVAMFDPAGKPIKVVVDSTFLVENAVPHRIAQVSGADGVADWATVLEKAMMKYDVGYSYFGPIDSMLEKQLLPAFTGNGDGNTFLPGSLTASEMKQLVSVALAGGEFLTGSFFNADPLGGDKTIVDHGYTVTLPSDSKTDLLDMRNPWGMNPWAQSGTAGYDPSTNGLLAIPASTSPYDWPTIAELRLAAAPKDHCTGVTTPFVPPQAQAQETWVHDEHARNLAPTLEGP